MATHGDAEAMVKCPACGKNIHLATNATKSEQPPEAGDYGVCLYCAAVLVYDSPTTLHVITLKEELAMPDKHRDTVSEAQAAVKAVQAARRAKER